MRHYSFAEPEEGSLIGIRGWPLNLSSLPDRLASVIAPLTSHRPAAAIIAGDRRRPSAVTAAGMN